MNTSNDSKKVVIGMAIIALSGLLLGAVLGYFATDKLLRVQILNHMLDDGYVYTGDATATSEDIVSGKTAVSQGELLNGVIEVFDTSDATATSDKIVRGKTAYVDGKLVVGTLNTTPADEITPKNEAYTIQGNVYVVGNIVIKGDSDFVGSNIKHDVTIFNVRGSYREWNTNTEEGGE